jgi:hypothetical protein
MRITAILFVDENGPVPPVPICNPKSDLPLAQAGTGSINARSLTALCSDVFFNSSALVIARQRQKGTGRGKRHKGMIEMNWVASSELLYQASSRVGSAVGFGTLDVGWKEHFAVNLFSQRQLADTPYLNLSVFSRKTRNTNIFWYFRKRYCCCPVYVLCSCGVH